MMEARLIFMAIVCLCIAQLAFATETNFTFKSSRDQQRYTQILKETRCLVCQNLSLYDSNSALANDMRVQIYTLISSGASNSTIHDYLRERYGDSIMFMPPWRASTAFLWLGPFLLLGAGFAGFRWYTRNNRLIPSYHAC